MRVGDRLLAVLAADIGRNVGHGAGPEQRHHGHDVLDVAGPEVFEISGHARALQLEDADRLPRGEQVVRLAVVQRDTLQIDAVSPGAFDDLHRGVENGEVRQTEEVHLQQTNLLDRDHVVLGHHQIALGRFLQRHVLDQRVARDDHAGRMRAGVPGHSLQLVREIQHPVNLCGLLREVLQLRLAADGVVQRGVERDEFGNPVDVAIGQPHHPADIPHSLAGAHRPEGDDLGHVIRAVLVHHVADDFITPAIHEVDIDVRHRVPLRVQEPLKRQPVLQGIHVGDPQGVQHQAAGGGSADGGENAAALGERHEILHD